MAARSGRSAAGHETAIRCLLSYCAPTAATPAARARHSGEYRRVSIRAKLLPRTFLKNPTYLKSPTARADYEALLSDLETNFAARTKALLNDNLTDLDVEIQVLRDRLKLES